MPETPKIDNQPPTEAPQKKEEASVVKLIEVNPVNEQHRESLLQMDRESLEEDGMLNATTGKKTAQENEEFENWINCRSVRKLWLIQNQQQKFIGFVNSYDDEHVVWVREKGDLGEDIAIEELSSFILDEYTLEGNADQENQALFQAVSSIFFSKEHEVDAITVYVTHNEKNFLDDADTVFASKFGFRNIGSLRYPEDDEVDSTCFLLTKDDFIRAQTQGMTKPPTPPPPAVES